MTDYSTVCWDCKQTDLENMGAYVKCRQCGATWNEVPRLTAPDFVIVSLDTDKHPTKKYESTRLHPSKMAARKAEKARSTKEEI